MPQSYPISDLPSVVPGQEAALVLLSAQRALAEPVPHAVVTVFWAPVVQKVQVQDSQKVAVFPVSLAMAEGSSQAFELQALVLAFHVVSRGLFQHVVPSPPVPIPRQVAQVLLVALMVFLPVAPVSLQASVVPQHFGPFVNENHEYLY
jgi:hypothetical protein